MIADVLHLTWTSYAGQTIVIWMWRWVPNSVVTNDKAERANGDMNSSSEDLMNTCQIETIYLSQPIGIVRKDKTHMVF